jgi:hypothetical protein
MFCLNLHGVPEDWGSRFLRNVGMFLPIYMASHRIRQRFSYSPPWESELLHALTIVLKVLLWGILHWKRVADKALSIILMAHRQQYQHYDWNQCTVNTDTQPNACRYRKQPGHSVLTNKGTAQPYFLLYSIRMRVAEHVARMGRWEVRPKILVERNLGDMCIWEDNIKMHPKETWCKMRIGFIWLGIELSDGRLWTRVP